jgi:predicted nuclease of predicted toxin-antitoxin system
LKLLVDENLAPRLADDLADLFPGTIHVISTDLGSARDAVIWEYAKAHGFTLLTKDKDFASRSLASNAPPKVILLQTGNCALVTIERLMRANAIRLSEFDQSGRSLLILK